MGHENVCLTRPPPTCTFQTHIPPSPIRQQHTVSLLDHLLGVNLKPWMQLPWLRRGEASSVSQCSSRGWEEGRFLQHSWIHPLFWEGKLGPGQKRAQFCGCKSDSKASVYQVFSLMESGGE
ncbi:hypothetical protein TNCV_3094101 [Trichonephila clavipes]|nr:hypothetical protein TNCV_3094101 [Trichonephila clavipes]